jgi:signal peptidase I
LIFRKKNKIEDESKDNNTKPSKKGAIRENVEAILIAIVLALFIRTFIVQAFKIPSGSMKETLQIGDHILVNKFIFGVKLPFTEKTIIPVKNPERGDIVVFKYPEDPDKDFIKRVVGVEGDKIEISNKQVYVNDSPLVEDYTIFKDSNLYSKSLRDNFGPVTVPEKSLFVMGDNRDNSHDSRFWGFVNLKAVRGKAFIIYWSWNGENNDSLLDYVRWNRFGKLLK